MGVTLATYSGSLLSIFRPAAEELVRNSNLSPTDIIAKAIAKIAGHTELRRRSLITGQDTFATMMLQIGKPMYSATFAFNSLRRVLSEDAVGKIKGMSLTKDNLGAVFDIPSDLVDEFLAAASSDRLSITILDSLPELQVRPDRNQQGRGGGHGGRGAGGGWNGGGRGGNTGNFSNSGASRGAVGGPMNWHGRGTGGNLPGAAGSFGTSFMPMPGRGGGFGNPSMTGAGRTGGRSSGPWRGGRGAGGRGRR
eukprot:c17628_g1_i2 orf=1052-1804(+)